MSTNPQEPAAFLFELRGESPGTAHPLSRDVFRIGSDSENDLVLQDPGVALYQAEIHILEGRHQVRNLSAHGNAYLNGENFEEAWLQKGDILTLGDSTVRFVMAGEVLSQEELWRPVGGRQHRATRRLRPGRKILYLAGLGAVAVGFLIVMMVRQPGTKDTSSPEVVNPVEAVRRSDHRDLESLYDRGVAYASARRWDEAIVIFEKMSAEAPNYKDTDAIFRQSLLESESADNLYLARGLFLEEQWDEAGQKLKMIPEESVHFREAERLLRDIQIKAATKRLERAGEYLRQEEWAAAEDEAEAVLLSDPDNEAALEVMSEIRQTLSRSRKSWQLYGKGRGSAPEEGTARTSGDSVKIVAKAGTYGKGRESVPEEGTARTSGDSSQIVSAERVQILAGTARTSAESIQIVPETRAEDDTSPAKSSQTGTKDAKSRAKSPEVPIAETEVKPVVTVKAEPRARVEAPVLPEPPKGSPEWTVRMAVAAYRKGDAGESLRQLDLLLKSGADNRQLGVARDLMADLRSATSLYQQADTLQKRGSYAEAVEMWERFLEKDRKISGLQESVFFRNASVSLAQIYSRRGQEGFSAGDWVRASKFWNMAKRINPRDENAQKGLQRLSESAQRFYREGYSLQEINPERAIEIWKMVLQIVPPEHPYYQEAKRQLSRYSGRP